MLLINTTFLVESGVEREWTSWAYDVYIPATKAVGGKSAKLLHILADPQQQGVSYALQFELADHAAADRWLDCHQPALLGVVARRWQQRVLHFTTVMEEVERG